MGDKKFIIGVDFDNTLFQEVYPQVGELIAGAKETLQWLDSLGHTIIIDTCRNNGAEEAARYALLTNQIPFHYFNANTQDRIDEYGGDTRKMSVDIDIDDKSIDLRIKGKVNWNVIRSQLELLIFGKKKIICVVGESGTGKTTMVEYLGNKYGVKMIESYTDRPKRKPDEVGHTFLSEKEFDKLNMADMIAFTAWPNGNGGVTRYCCLYKDVTHPIMLYVIDERGLQYLRRYWGHLFDIVAIRMFSSEFKRAKLVSPERMKRDEGLFTLGYEHFDYFIDNDYTDAMYERYDQLFNKISNR